MKVLNELFATALCVVSFGLACIAIVLLFGEENPYKDFIWYEIIGIKILAGGTLYLLYKGLEWRGKHNLIPYFLVGLYKDFFNTDYEDEYRR